MMDMFSSSLVTAALGPLSSLFSASFIEANGADVARIELHYRGLFASRNSAAEDLAAAERALNDRFNATAIGYTVLVTERALIEVGCRCGAVAGALAFCPCLASEEDGEEDERCVCGATRPADCECKDADYFDRPVAA